MLERYSIIGITFAVILVCIDLYLVKRRRIRAQTFTLWFMIAMAIGIFSTIPSLFEFLYIIFGTEALISSVTVVAFFSLLLLIFYLHFKLEELTVEVAKLVAEVSALQYDPENKKRDERSKE